MSAFWVRYKMDFSSSDFNLADVNLDLQQINSYKKQKLNKNKRKREKSLGTNLMFVCPVQEH